MPWIDPARTNVEFAVRHLMISTVKGRFTGIQGTVRLDEAAPSRSKVEATVDETGGVVVVGELGSGLAVTHSARPDPVGMGQVVQKPSMQDLTLSISR